MIEVIFTIDYEIYGNGTGSLDDLVYGPTRQLKELFQRHDARFVNFVEVAEFQKIDECATDPAIDLVKQQIRELHQDEFEIALHLHPQWANARYESGRWSLDLKEYNLCKLPRERIAQIVDDSLAYMRRVVGDSDFTPLSFRAGNWLFQPTATVASVLAERGIRIDSSVFKGGVQRNHKLDYRPSLRNGHYWPFNSDVNQPDSAGPWIEVPIHADMVPFWKMATSKRMASKNQFGAADQSTKQKVGRALDFLRFQYPLKLDFCRMTLGEMTSMIERIIERDQTDAQSYRPIVAIGHSKDLTDFNAVDSFLTFLRSRKINVATFEDIYPRLAASLELPERASSAQSPQTSQPRSERSPLPRYVLISPARNEAAYIEKTIQSVVAQTHPPLRWVIVSDGSTDGTDEIVKKYQSKYDWIELVRMPERKERHFGGKVLAFNAGRERVADLNYEVIGNLDTDVSFDPDYFNFLLTKFAENPRLGVGGTPFREGSFQYDFRFTNIEHVSGQIQMFRRECFDEIGGYRPIKTGGIDLVAVTTARMKGWQTRTFLEKTYEHHRRMSSAKHSTWGIAFDGGRTDYTHGCDPVWEVFRSIYQMTHPPIVVHGGLNLFGYFWAMLTRAERVVSPEFIQFRKIEQRRRLRDFSKNMLWRQKPSATVSSTNNYRRAS